MLMRVATVISSRGTCTRAYVGAVIAIEGRVISMGYVGAPSGMPHCIEVGDEIGEDGGCIRTVHAEANAIAWAARNGFGTEEAELFCTHEPCLACAKLIVNAGITRVVYEHPYRKHDGITLLNDAGIEIFNMPAPEDTFDPSRGGIMVIDDDDDDNDDHYKRVN